MININLKHNYGYQWSNGDGIYTKGYYYNKDKKLCKGKDIEKEFSNVSNEIQFKSLLSDANGIFSIIICKANKCYAAVDIVRTFPLFYSKINSEYYISDSVKAIQEKIKDSTPNTKAVNEFLYTAYVTGKETLIHNIFQIEAGQILIIENNTLKTSFYHVYLADELYSHNLSQLTKMLDHTIANIFERLANNITNEKIFVPLSGGYDSRLIALMLKKYGLTNVVCYTYGEKYNNREIEISKEVAKRLNFDWLYIEYNDNLIGNYLESTFFNKYYKFSANYVSMFFMQEYFAVKYLMDNNYIENNTVFIPGHSGDVIAGSQLNFVQKNTSQKILINTILNNNYNLISINRNMQASLFSRINVLLPNIPVETYALYENWNVKERQAKYIVNSSNIYNFIGSEQRLPFWDKEFVNFFSKVPYKFKKGKFLYNNLLKSYFLDYNISFKKELQASYSQIIFQNYKNRIKKYLPSFIKKKNLHRNDWFCHNEITKKMIIDMQYSNYPINMNYNDFGALMVQWYLFRELFS